VKTAQRRVAALLVALGLLLASGGLTACEDPPKQERQPATSQPDKRARGGRDRPPCAKGEHETIKDTCSKNKPKEKSCPPGKKKLLGVCVEDVD